MLNHLLTGDPRTSPDVLRALANSYPDPDTALDLAVHPNLPGDVTVPGRRPTTDELHNALTHPHLPARRRRAYVEATPESAFIDALATRDVLTGDDIATLAAVHLSISPRHLLAHPSTPSALVRAYLRRDPSRWQPNNDRHFTWSDDAVFGCALALRHGLVDDSYPDIVLAAARTADPTGAFAQSLLGLIGGHTHRWATALTATADPTLACAGLDLPATDPAYTAITAKVLGLPFLPADLRYRAAQRYSDPSDSHYYLGRYASPRATSSLATSPNTLVRYGVAANPCTDAATLDVLLAAADNSAALGWAVAMHPNAAPSTQRAALHVHDPSGRGRGGERHLGAELVTADPTSGLLNMGVPDLHRYTGRSYGAHVHVGHHLTRARLAHHAHAYSTEEALAFIALAPTFPGTLRELLDTVAAMVT